MDSANYRKRNVSDGDSGFESALSSRSSSISLEESPELGKLLDPQISKVEPNLAFASVLRQKFREILTEEEDISQDVADPELYIIRDKLTGNETLYKPPSKLKFSPTPPQIGETYSADEYNRINPIPRSQLFNSRLEFELEKQLDKMELVEVDLLMDPAVVPPPSLGIRVIGVNMIHGVSDKLNIYVKRVLEGSVAGLDGRIRVNDHIVEVNGVSLVGVSQKLAANTLSSCAICPQTGVVRFVVARDRDTPPDNNQTEIINSSITSSCERKNCEPNPATSKEAQLQKSVPRVALTSSQLSVRKQPQLPKHSDPGQIPASSCLPAPTCEAVRVQLVESHAGCPSAVGSTGRGGGLLLMMNNKSFPQLKQTRKSKASADVFSEFSATSPVVSGDSVESLPFPSPLPLSYLVNCGVTKSVITSTSLPLLAPLLSHFWWRWSRYLVELGPLRGLLPIPWSSGPLLLHHPPGKSSPPPCIGIESAKVVLLATVCVIVGTTALRHLAAVRG